jgi:sulfoxide reductase catalytic subunit YedY
MKNTPPEPSSSEITPEGLYISRREFIADAARLLGTTAVVGSGLVYLSGGARAGKPRAATGGDVSALTSGTQASPFDTSERRTPFESVTSYNNFYEFGTSKSDPAENAHALRPRPWTISFEGEIAKPQIVDVDTLTKWFPLEERVYRMRCVEAWSMVIPWLGFPLGALVRRLEPTSRAKYVAFTTLLDPVQMPGQRGSVLDWPYVEGLRLDEAMHPLTLLAVGLYGKTLPNQNGAPVRLVVPWKYGFKGIK